LRSADATGGSNATRSSPITWTARQKPNTYVEGLREDGEPLDSGVIRRSIPLPA